MKITSFCKNSISLIMVSKFLGPHLRSEQGELNTRRGQQGFRIHFAVTFLDCWKTSSCVTTIIKIVNNNTNDKQTFGASLALDEDSPYTNSCLFTLDYCCYAKTSSPVVQKRHRKVYENPISPSWYSILLGSEHPECSFMVQTVRSLRLCRPLRHKHS